MIGVSWWKGNTEPKEKVGYIDDLVRMRFMMIDDEGVKLALMHFVFTLLMENPSTTQNS